MGRVGGEHHSVRPYNIPDFAPFLHIKFSEKVVKITNVLEITIPHRKLSVSIYNNCILKLHFMLLVTLPNILIWKTSYKIYISWISRKF